MIITFDTSILVRTTSAAQGPARKLLEIIAGDPRHVIVLSPFILQEVERVFLYPRLQMQTYYARKTKIFIRRTSPNIAERLAFPLWMMCHC